MVFLFLLSSFSGVFFFPRFFLFLFLFVVLFHCWFFSSSRFCLFFSFLSFGFSSFNSPLSTAIFIFSHWFIFFLLSIPNLSASVFLSSFFFLPCFSSAYSIFPNSIFSLFFPSVVTLFFCFPLCRLFLSQFSSLSLLSQFISPCSVLPLFSFFLFYFL